MMKIYLFVKTKTLLTEQTGNTYMYMQMLYLLLTRDACVALGHVYGKCYDEFVSEKSCSIYKVHRIKTTAGSELTFDMWPCNKEWWAIKVKTGLILSDKVLNDKSDSI